MSQAINKSLSPSPEEIIISPEKSLTNLRRELWAYKDLFYILAWRDFKVRYKQTAIGAAWAIIRPLLTMIVFTVVFGRLAKLPSDGVPYPVLVFTAMLPWYFFASSFQASSNALISNADMIRKIYFPRIIMPISKLFVNLVDFLISFAILIMLMVWYRVTPSINILFLPLLLLMAGMAAAGAGLWFAALNVTYRDVCYLVPFIVQLGLYISPVGFSSSVIPDQWRIIYSINPMVGVIDGFRWAVFGQDVNISVLSFILSTVFIILLFASGIWFFQKTERNFADVI